MDTVVMTVFVLISDFKENSPKNSPLAMAFIIFLLKLYFLKLKTNSFYLKISECSYCDDMSHHFRLSLGHRT